MPTEPLSDRQKAVRAAIKATVEELLSEVYNPALTRKATFLLTVVAHWEDDGDDECECPICLM